MSKTNNSRKSVCWRARKRAGLNQKTLAHLLGVSLYQVSRFEKGNSLPKMEVAFKLEILFGLPLRVLFEPIYLSAVQALEEKLAGKEIASQPKPGEASDYCSVINLFNGNQISGADHDSIRTHIRTLMDLQTDELQRHPLKLENRHE